MKPKKGLGKGLDALIPSFPKEDRKGWEVEKDNLLQEINVDLIVSSPYQVRRQFDEEKLEELVCSIREHGVVQPVVVRVLNKGKYELIVGERRWRACRRAGFKKIPAVIKNISEKQAAEMVLVENIQREDLNPLEEAQAYFRLQGEFGLTQDEVASRVGKSRSHVANFMRLLKLPAELQEFILTRKLSAGHARCLLGLDDERQMKQAADVIITRGLSVRQSEDLVRQLQAEQLEEKPKKKSPDPFLKRIQDNLCRHLRTAVCLKGKGKKGGTIEIKYTSDEDLKRLLEILYSPTSNSSAIVSRETNQDKS